jgi:hypothetical protein
MSFAFRKVGDGGRVARDLRADDFGADKGRNRCIKETRNVFARQEEAHTGHSNQRRWTPEQVGVF